MKNLHEAFENFIVFDERAKTAYSKDIFERAERALLRHGIRSVEDLEGISLRSLQEPVNGYRGLGPKGTAITYVLAKHYKVTLVDIPDDEYFKHCISRLDKVAYFK